MSTKFSKAFKLGRDAEKGVFVPVKKARNDPRRYIVEHIPKKGYGVTDRKHKQ